MRVVFLVRAADVIACPSVTPLNMNTSERPVQKSPLATNNLLEDTDGLRRPPHLRGATQSISVLEQIIGC